MNIETYNRIRELVIADKYAENRYFVGVASIMGTFAVGFWLGGSPHAIQPGMVVLTTFTASIAGGFALATAPVLHKVAIEKAYEADQKAQDREFAQPQAEEQNGFRLSDLPHLFLMWTPNLLNPHKLVNNLRHPIHEALHTRHTQYPLEDHPTKYVVEHTHFGKLVTVDVVEKDRFYHGLLLRIAQLFRRDFYYGHAQYFPQAFRLVNRTYVKDAEGFEIEAYIKEVLGKR